MTSARRLGWSLIEGDACIRNGSSLARLRRVRPTTPDLGALFRRLLIIEPLGLPAERPEAHLGDCLRQAHDILAADEIGLNRDQRVLLETVYETGLLRGYDGLGRPDGIDALFGLTAEVLSGISVAGWRHGEAIKARWRTYSELMSVMFGEDALC